jgi:hypothetical protein
MAIRVARGVGFVSLGIVVAGGCAEKSDHGDPAPLVQQGISIQAKGGEGQDASLAAHPDSATCTQTLVGSVFTRHLDVTDVGGAGGRISLVQDIRFDFSVQPFSTLTESDTVSIGGSEVISYTVTDTSGQPIQATVQWGPHIRGATNGTFTLSNNTLTGNIDGRVFAPFPLTGDPSTAPFLDGGPSPALKSNQPLLDALQRLSTAASSALSHCSAGPADATNPVVSSGPSTDFDFGHNSATYSATGCNGAKAACAGGATLGTVGCILLASPACAVTFGLACGACVAAGVLTSAGCIATVETTGACCPVACGNSQFISPATCCFGNETCLNAGEGLCCSQDKTPCVGHECCGSNESCITGGLHKGNCCLDQNLCGQDCCSSGSQCLNNSTCCDSTQNAVCGQGGFEVCCPKLTAQCLPDGSCCAKDRVCGSACCRSSETCVNGQCAACSVGDVGCTFKSNSFCCQPGVNCCTEGCCQPGLICCTPFSAPPGAPPSCNGSDACLQ